MTWKVIWTREKNVWNHDLKFDNYIVNNAWYEKWLEVKNAWQNIAKIKT